MNIESEIVELNKDLKILTSKLQKAQDSGNRIKAKDLYYRVRELEDQIRSKKRALAIRDKQEEIEEEEKPKQEKKKPRPKKEPKLIREDGKEKEVDEAPKEEPGEVDFSDESTISVEAVDLKFDAVNSEMDSKSRLTKDEIIVDNAMAKLFDPNFEEFLFTFDKEETGEILVILLKELRQSQAELNSINAFLKNNDDKAKGFVTETRRSTIESRKELIEGIINKINI